MTGSLLDEAMAGDPGRPFVTFYDDRTGERVELSVATLGNWVAKTCGLLVDGLATEPGDIVQLSMPVHWLRPVWALAAWQVGLVVEVITDVAGDTSAPGRLAVCDATALAEGAGTAAEDIIAVSLRPMGAGFAPGELPGHVIDYNREVAGYADRFTAAPLSPGAPALRAAGRTYTLAELRDVASSLASAWQLTGGGRLLVAEHLGAWPDLLAETLVPLGRDASVVLCVGAPGEDADAERLARRADSERVTARAEVMAAESVFRNLTAG